MSNIESLRRLADRWMVAADQADEIGLKRKLAAHATHLAMLAAWLDHDEPIHDAARGGRAGHQPDRPAPIVSFDIARSLRSLWPN